ncbi:hypothetical protein DITRI_Ditri19aG0118600 [Diplodiscus trichospermus]
MSFFVIVWSIWIHRNNIVFHGKRMGIVQVIDLIKIRIVSWVKAKWLEIGISQSDIARSLPTVSIPDKLAKVRRIVSWSKPPRGTVKFNVDGSSLGKPGFVNIGGILRDHLGHVKFWFSKSIGTADSNYIEILAIREAFLLFWSLP